MNLLIDTHSLNGAPWRHPRLSRRAAAMIDDPANAPLFSIVTLWEVAIKRAQGRADFIVEPRPLRAGLLSAISGGGRHALEVARLPRLHRDPLERMPVAQACAESMTLLTVDAAPAACDAPVRVV